MTALAGVALAVGAAVVVPTFATAEQPREYENLVLNGDFEASAWAKYWKCTPAGDVTPPPAANEFSQLMPDWNPGKPAAPKPSAPATKAPASAHRGRAPQQIIASPPPPPPAANEFSQLLPGGESALKAHRPAATGTGTAQPDVGDVSMHGQPTAKDRAECAQVVKVQPGTKYLLTGWVRGRAFIGSDYGSVSAPAGGDWMQLKTSFTTGHTTTTVRVEVYGSTGAGAFTADNIELTETDRDKRVPTAPARVQGTAVTSRSAILTWPAAPGASSYRVSTGGRNLGVTTTRKMLVQGMAPGGAYTYTVTPLSVAGAGKARDGVVKTVAAAAAPPAGFCAKCAPDVHGAAGALTAFWTEVPNATDKYTVYLDGVRAGWTPELRCLIKKLTPGRHTIRVSAWNSAGESPLSPATTVTVS